MTETHYIVDILILLAAAVVAVPLFQRLGLGVVLGFVVAGAVIGPWGLGFIDAVEEIRHLAEFGVVFLLFVIGIELKPSRLWLMRRSVFGLGTAQVLVTGTLITLVALGVGIPLRTALVVGFGLALSSTAFGLQILSEKGEFGAAYGRSAFAILLLQDLAIVPLMALLPLLAQRELSITQDVELAALESLAIIIGVFVLGRIFLRPLLRFVASSRRNPEIFTATGILLVLGAAWLTDWAGLSMALGAFLGGLLLADSRYRHQIMADIQPFRGLLLGLFFMSIGMTINFGLLGSQGILVISLVAGLLLLKAMVLWVLCRATGSSSSDSIHVALLLGQAGEFGFILFGLANLLGVMEGDLYQLLLLVIALSMAATPLMVKLSPWLGRVQQPVTAPATPPPSEPIPDSRDHVIVAGFGRIGSVLARNLGKAGVSYLVLEVDPIRVARARALDYPVFYGDASRLDVLKSAGAANASLIVFAMNRMEGIGQAVVAVKEAFPDLPVFARAWDIKMAQRLIMRGATYAIPETIRSGIQLTREVFDATGVSNEVSARLIQENYGGEHHKIAQPQVSERRSGYRSILLVLTPNIDKKEMLRYAVALAEDHRSTLAVVEVLAENTADAEEGVSSPDELEEQMTESRRRQMEELISHSSVKSNIEVKVLVGRSHEAITREVISNDRDLVIKAVESNNSIKERLFGDNDTRLIKSCPCPVLLVRSIPPRPYQHRCVVAGVYQDEHPGGRHNDRHGINCKILENATRLVTAQFAHLHIVHAWDAYGEQYMRSGRSSLQSDADNYVVSEEKRNRQALESNLSEMRESVASDVLPAFNPECHMVKGNHRDEILRFSKSINADLVVVGGAINSGVTGLIVDSTAEAIAKELSCSVLVVKSPDFATPVEVDDL